MPVYWIRMYTYFAEKVIYIFARYPQFIYNLISMYVFSPQTNALFMSCVAGFENSDVSYWQQDFSKNDVYLARKLTRTFL